MDATIKADQGRTADKADQAEHAQAKPAPRKRKSIQDKLASAAELLTKAGAAAGAGKPPEGQGAAQAGDKAEAAGKPAEAKGEPESGPAGDPQGKPKPKTWKEAASALGLEPDELYALELDLSAEKGKATLGQIKDLLQAHGAELPEISDLIRTSREAKDAAEAERVGTTSEALQIRTRLLAAMGAMGQVPKGLPEAIEPIMREQRAQAERLTVEHIPAWRDGAVMSRDKAEIAADFARFGFTRAELENVFDPRFWLREQAIMATKRAAQKALQAGESPDNPGRVSSGPTSRGAMEAHRIAGQRASLLNAKAGGRQSRVSAVAALLSTNKGN